MSKITKISDLINKHIIIYVVGDIGYHIHQLLSQKVKNIAIDAFCDTEKVGIDIVTNLKIIPLDELKNYSDAIIIIGLLEHEKSNEMRDIEETFKHIGFASDKILKYSQFLMLFKDYDVKEFEWKVYGEKIFNLNKNILLIERLSSHIIDNDESIVDLGAGNMSLKKFISPTQKYYPVDFKSRCSETVICDFDNAEFPNIYADVYVLSGVLPYINAPIWLLEQSAKFTLRKIIVALSNCNYANQPDYMKLRGWKNYIFFDEIKTILNKYRFVPSEDITMENIKRRFVVYEKGEELLFAKY
jgi:hypothetical protein